MVFKRPTNSRDDRNGKSKGPSKSSDNKRASAPRGKSSRSADKSGNDSTKKRYSSGPAAERSSFSSGAEKKSFGPRKPYSGRPTGNGEEERPKRAYGGGEPAGEKKSFAPRNKPYTGRPTGSEEDRPKRSFGGDKKEFSPRSKPYSGRSAGDEDRPKKSFSDERPKKSFDDDRPKRSFGSDAPRNRKPTGADFGDKPKGTFGDKPAGDRKFSSRPTIGYKKRDDDDAPARKPVYDKITRDRDAPVKTLRAKKPAKKAADDGLIRLNRYIANAGICSRRKADELIIAGVVSVNGEVVNELGLKVDPMKDEIRYNGETLKREKNVYVLLNKPKDYITTTDDPQERRTVMQLVEKASRERIYPIGRLDRNTTGLLLMTNDGDLADKLSHPRSNITKLYHVELSKSLAQGDLNKLLFGLELEDGPIKPDSVSYVTGGTKKEVGVQIHSGKNRIVRRMFEHLGYEVVKLDRVVYANLTKKDLPRGRWRFLDEKEVIQLKHLIK
ncbi:pseudouridine synthase [Mucilaginibacter sp. UR6-11]|uniref:pseudouridine synthase n=1 Tax=Mucilaginibacter sp. UR6-11 TaxID=1435644 RepID=UPI001E440642|nr:pseudouridine synthase [Mucilaginibacter sp. UR6-11]MCC8424626.1 pseudouridine synthase [Mucilaginibacter sp. UR6-11]